MKPLLTVIGIILVIMVLVFTGQGSGYFPYPASSFMISQRGGFITAAPLRSPD